MAASMVVQRVDLWVVEMAAMMAVMMAVLMVAAMVER